jgi:hypothetical protein
MVRPFSGLNPWCSEADASERIFAQIHAFGDILSPTALAQ